MEPPTTIGSAAPCAGFGSTDDGGMRVNGPVNETGSSAQSVRQISMASSARGPRSSYGTPTPWYSSTCHPTPTPKITRPPLRASSVATRLASTSGACSGITTTLVPSFTVLVQAARYESHSSGSGITVPGAPGIRPFSEYE